MSREVDFIIVGQGLAGSLLAWELIQNGKSVHIFDDDHQGAASKVAAGIINPITGRRFAKSWRIDEFLPFAKEYYKTIESKFQIKIWHDRSVLRFLKGNKDINDWYGRSSWKGFEDYMQDTIDMTPFESKFHLPFGIGEIKPAAQVNLATLIQEFKAFFLKQDILSCQKIDYEQVKYEDIQVYFNSVKGSKIIFCEGQKAKANPHLAMIPFEPAKGEVLIVKVPGLDLEHFIKNKLMLAPLGNDLYWAGSNYEWNSPHDRPTPGFRNDFVKQLKLTLKLPFEVVDHIAAIRPTIKDRRPVLGTHPRNKLIAVFNGLGTKGASLAPYWARQMALYLTTNQIVDPEVDINRFFR